MALVSRRGSNRSMSPKKGVGPPSWLPLTAGVRRDALLHRGNRREIINREDWPMHKLYSVNADVDTGHWLDTPEPLGKVSLAEFDKLSDTPDATFTTSRSAGGRRIRTRGPTAKGK